MAAQSEAQIGSDWLLYISRTLSFSVIIMSVVMKLPQVQKLYKAGSAKGISIRGYWLEVAAYMVGASYGYYYDYHYSTYLEVVLLAIQSGAIIVLSINYTRKLNTENITFTILLLISVCLASIKAIPGTVLDSLLLLAIPLSAGSKLMQIFALYDKKSGGDVSLVTWSLATYGCAARLVTTLVEVSSRMIFTSYLISVVLNGAIVSQILYYGAGLQQSKHRKHT